MKVCQSCRTEYLSSLPSCPACGATATRVDGFTAYAPTLAHGGGGYKSIYFADLASLEAGNFWFRSRNRLIVWAIGHYCAGTSSMLEIGCGTGYVLSGVAQNFPSMRLSGSEIFTEGLAFAASRIPQAEFMQMDARDLPFRNEFDLIGAFDVIEHIAEDQAVIAQVASALRPGGLFLVTVPQHRWLWSRVDAYACHERRYSRAELHDKLLAGGFTILRSTSFVSFLLPAMMLSRLVQSHRPVTNFDPSSELKLHPWLNALLMQLTRLEYRLIRWGLDFPLGGSRLVVARKTG